MPYAFIDTQQIASGPTFSMALIKKLVQRSLYVDFAESLR